ncbi:MAG TPA: PilZ domain-containing protein [Candidatus Angelobacter sp.]|nr:PilZ domain-containing protein [Candidatus Angelobacter sp.]
MSVYDFVMQKRREKRHTVPITVKLWGLDSHGKVFSQNARTLDIAINGARLFGVTAALERGFIVGLQCGNMRARFMVVWVGEKGSSREGQIGLRAAENGIWSVALPRASDEDFSNWLAETYLEAETAVSS